ncbi:uncharacterized protein LOC129582166 isoform X2 [Paramacrobiotus metropolitanus]|uniref:uncharacterized protein LOC129582166 isoform X2 n=1 Tax=Paramacrobiotus metropolitanus TaxID=2943436 RepID=UPI002445DBF5|nr:uncharacterized protein LOC129582166 isoform X2 [Paramacrobiotus metropolitanus]
MADSCPVLSVTTLAKISELINSKWNSGKSITMASEHSITVASQGDLWSNPSLFFLDLAASPPQVTRKDFKRHRMRDRIVSATHSPNGEFCFIQDAANVLRVIILEKETVIASFVDFAKWIDLNCIAVITNREVTHMNVKSWNVSWSCLREDDGAGTYSVTDYQINRSEGWSFLTAVKLDVDQARGLVEVFHMKKKTSATFPGFAAAFLPPQPMDDIAVLIAHTVTSNNNHRILVLYRHFRLGYGEVFFSNTKTSTLEIKCPMDAKGTENDIPIAVTLHPMDDHSLAFITTKMGYVHLVDYRSMRHLASRKLAEGESTNCVARGADSSGGLTVISSDGLVLRVSLSFDHLIATLLDKNLPMEAGKYALRLSAPMENSTFMRVISVVLDMESVDFATFLRLNAVHLSAEQAIDVFGWAVDIVPPTPHQLMLTGHLAMKLSEKAGLDVLIAMFERKTRNAKKECLPTFLKSLSPKKMSESALLELVKVALQHGLIQILEFHFIANQSKILHPESVVDSLLSETVTTGVQRAVDELVEKMCIKYGLIVKLVTHKIRNGRPVRLNLLLEKLPIEEAREQLRLIIEILLNDNADLAALEMNLNLGLTVNMLRGVYPDILQSIEQKGNRKTTMSFLEYLAGKGVPDESVHSQLVKMYIENMGGEKLDQILKNNKFYDAVAVGQWCEEKKWPMTALSVYEERHLSEDFIRLSGNLGVFKRQFNYLLNLRSKALWESVLSPVNGKRSNLVNVMVGQPEAGYEAASGDFEQVAVLIETMAETDLVSETQTLIRRLLPKIVDQDQIRYLQKQAVRSLLRSGYPAAKFQKLFSDQLYTYDPCTVADVLVQVGMLRLAKDILVRGKFWKEAAQLVAANKTEDLGDIKQLAFLSRDPDLLATVGEDYLASGDLVLALQYFVEAGRFTKYKLVCSMIPLDKNFAEWELLVRFLEGCAHHHQRPSGFYGAGNGIWENQPNA